MSDETPTASFMAKAPAPVVDALGRSITVRKMTGGTRARAMRAAGKDANEYYISMAIIAAAVVQVGDQPFPFPANTGQIEKILDVLGDEGMEAVAATLLPETVEQQQEVVNSAKNL